MKLRILNIHSTDNDELIEYIETEQVSFGAWLDAILKSVETTVSLQDNGDRDNIMFNPAFAKHFIRLCKMLPLWTSICSDFFNLHENTSSSANVESYFKEVKESFKNLIPCSIDKFMIEIMDITKSMVIEASHTNNYVQFVGDVQRNETSLSDNSHSFEESTEKSAMNKNIFPETSVDTDEQLESTQPIQSGSSTTCIACLNNDEPSGAHKCAACQKNVHILPGCSVSYGDSEGYGEKRICIACNTKTSKKKYIQNSQDGNEIIQSSQEMKYKESWNKKSKQKRASKYLSPMPNWLLNTNINKKVKIVLLRNGNLIATTQKVTTGKVIGLTNTCTVDSFMQVSIIKKFHK